MENQLNNTPTIEESLATMENEKQLDIPITCCKELSFDIISFILTKLPVKSLLRFKSVSKPWLSLISGPDFTKQHLLTNTSSVEKRNIMWSCKGKLMDHFTLSHLLSTDIIIPRSLNDVSTDAKFKKHAKIIGSVNGLICVFVPPKLLILWNPSLRKRSVVPDADVPLSHDKRSFGFCYDSVTADYKIVGFFGSEESQYDLYPITKVFSLKTGEWKRIKSHKCAHFFEQNEPEISFGNGRFYWINCGIGNWAVHSLDLATGKYQSSEIPLDDMRMNCTMVVSNQNLVYVLGCRDRESYVWVMKEVGSKKKVVWTNVCTIEFEKLDLQLNAMFVFNCHLFDVLNSGEIMMRHIDSFLIYNPKDGSMKCCYIECPGNGIKFGACKFVESLVWV